MSARESIENFLYQKYGKAALTVPELAAELDKSPKTIYRLTHTNQLHLLPKFKRSSEGQKATYSFPIPFVAQFLCQDEE